MSAGMNMERLTERHNGKSLYSGGTLDDVLNKLADYEDAEERGMLLRLPCKVGDDVFVFREYLECKYDYECNDKDAYKCVCGAFCENEYKSVCIGKTQFQLQMFTEFGKTVFLTRAEAEKALEEMS